LKPVGFVQLKPMGRPQQVYCGWTPNHLLHEVLLTWFVMLFRNTAFRRGFDVNQDILADADMIVNGELFYVELDTGSVPYRRQKARWEKVCELCDEPFLVVCLTEPRMQGLMNIAKDLANVFLFTTLGRVRADPCGPVWKTADGEERFLDVN